MYPGYYKYAAILMTMEFCYYFVLIVMKELMKTNTKQQKSHFAQYLIFGATFDRSFCQSTGATVLKCEEYRGKRMSIKQKGADVNWIVMLKTLSPILRATKWGKKWWEKSQQNPRYVKTITKTIFDVGENQFYWIDNDDDNMKLLLYEDENRRTVHR